MDYRIIKSPSRGTLEIINRRAGLVNDQKLQNVDAIGLVQGMVIDMVCAADIAEKAVGVDAYDIRGLCPQHMTLLAICGDTASVTYALARIRLKMEEGSYDADGQAD